jgi:hypothetical protein
MYRPRQKDLQLSSTHSTNIPSSRYYCLVRQSEANCAARAHSSPRGKYNRSIGLQAQKVPKPRASMQGKWLSSLFPDPRGGQSRVGDPFCWNLHEETGHPKSTNQEAPFAALKYSTSYELPHICQSRESLLETMEVECFS